MRQRATLEQLVWHRLQFQRPVEEAAVIGLLRLWSGDPRRPRVVLEVRSGSPLQFLLGVPRRFARAVGATLLHALPGTRLSESGISRPSIIAAGGLRVSTQHRTLRTDQAEQTASALLRAIHDVRAGEHAALQVILGPRHPARTVPATVPAGHRRDGDDRRALGRKQAEPAFGCTVRFGVTAADSRRRRSLLAGLLAAVRVLEAPGVRFRLVPEAPQAFNAARSPWWWRLTLNVAELVPLGWPLGGGELAGVPSIHPRQLPPPPGTTNTGRVVALATAVAEETTLRLFDADSNQHVHVLGPTGSGKSVFLLNLITRSMEAGHAVLLVDPQGDLALRDVLARVPTKRRADVAVLDAADRVAPFGLNPLDARGRNPEVVADNLLSVFDGLYGDGLGPRSRDILQNSLHTLSGRSDASMVMLPLLLTHAGFRRSITQHVHDPIALGPFWQWYESLSEAERQAASSPLLNKIRPWLVRPSLRAVFGQRRPRLTIAEAFEQKKILLISLAEGQLGSAAAATLGAVVVAQAWQAITERVNLPPEQRHPVMLFLDEFASFLHLPTDLPSALARSRSMGCSWHLAHQALAQLSPAMRAAINANARSKVVFQLGSDDAAAYARMYPDLSAEDFTSLGRYEIYASLVAGGRSTPFASGRTLPPPPIVSDPVELIASSRQRYGQPLDEIEAGFAALLQPDQPTAQERPGRSRRRSS